MANKNVTSGILDNLAFKTIVHGRLTKNLSWIKRIAIPNTTENIIFLFNKAGITKNCILTLILNLLNCFRDLITNYFAKAYVDTYFITIVHSYFINFIMKNFLNIKNRYLALSNEH